MMDSDVKSLDTGRLTHCDTYMKVVHVSTVSELKETAALSNSCTAL